ncbi:MAG: NAD(P)H-dependent oxidoreductase [Lachnospiraceae bacterium]|nr:NAD(P)H-dependent oxidoreductase [Lachnospiraceae bacterium]
MNICVLNGSPRGKNSVTVHTSLYLEKRFASHHFEYLPVGTRINAYEKDLSAALAAINRADLIIFSYPVYTFIAPSQLHRFIAALKSSGADLSGKFVTQITTSKHFYDVTAHRYIEDNCFDMGMKIIHGLSADMDDLTTPAGQKDAEKFFEYVLWCVENDIFEPAPKKTPQSPISYTPSLPETVKSDAHDTVIVTDLRSDDESLKAMISDFQTVYPYKTRIINLAEYKFKGGCLGCFNCAGDGKCIHKDGFDSYLRETIQTAHAVVYAFTIRDHSMGPVFKTYDDRQFCNGHRTVTEGMPFAYIVNGDYEAETNLRMIIEGRSEVGHNFLAGVGYTAGSIESTAKRLAYALETQYLQPRNFYGIGGMKIFRDLIWLMRGIMKADHQFYKAHGVYDFPQKKWPQMLLMCFLGSMIRNPKIKKKMGNKFNEGMAAPYDKVVKAAKPR